MILRSTKLSGTYALRKALKTFSGLGIFSLGNSKKPRKMASMRSLRIIIPFSNFCDQSLKGSWLFELGEILRITL